ncbi:Wall-associated receptor kinase 2 [Rhynchospora pubera]|uniref:Wall-associated receptor kinase 2 n=1 Tax=Rhynchospora pubera TaxID=906938 RepID=A0AAV8HN20_9POAL|nr:Wall-associated receptor kinase 2 [Rhynchospora pubera]
MDIMKPKTLYKRTMTSVALLMLAIMFFMSPQIAAYPNALKNCQPKCGDIDIPYPFGIGLNCSLPGFEVSCNRLNNGSFAPFLFNDTPFLGTSPYSEYALVKKSMTYTCNMSNTIADDWNLSGTPYKISRSNLNMFTVIGCDISASITFGNETNMSQGVCVTTGCFSPESIYSQSNGLCSGIGCCQVFIPREINYYQVRLQSRDYNSSKYNSSQCGYVAFGDFSSPTIRTLAS